MKNKIKTLAIVWLMSLWIWANAQNNHKITQNSAKVSLWNNLNSEKLKEIDKIQIDQKFHQYMYENPELFKNLIIETEHFIIKIEDVFIENWEKNPFWIINTTITAKDSANYIAKKSFSFGGTSPQYFLDDNQVSCELYDELVEKGMIKEVFLREMILWLNEKFEELTASQWYFTENKKN